MQRVKKSFLPFLLALSILFSLIPAGTVFADTTKSEIYLNQVYDIAENGVISYRRIYSGNTINLAIGGSEIYIATYNSDIITSENFIISISDPTVARFDSETMTLKGIQRGVCDLTITSKSNLSISSTYEVKVNQYIERVEYSTDKLVLEADKLYKAGEVFSYKYYPQDNDDVVFLESSDIYSGFGVWTDTQIRTYDTSGDFYILGKTKTNVFPLPITINGSNNPNAGQKIIFGEKNIYSHRTTTVTCSLDIDVEDAEYEYVVERGKTTTTLQSRSKNKTCSWRPYYEGNYVVYATVWTKDGNSYRTCEIVNVLNSDSLFKVTNLSVSSSELNLGEMVELRSYVSGARGTVNYKYEYSKDNGKTWNIIRDYKNSYNTFWTPSDTGTYLIKVTARDYLNTTVTKKTSITVKNSITINSFSVSNNAPLTNTVVRLSASATSTLGSVGYKFLYKKANGSWVTIRDLSASSSCTWTPTSSGEYTLKVIVKDTIGTELSKTVVINVDDKITLNYSVSSTSIKLGESITFDAVAKNATGTAKFKYAMLNKDNSWTVLRGYNTVSKFVWTPSNSGNYTVRIFATDGESTSKRDVDISIVEDLVINSFTSSEVNINLGDSVTLNVLASGSNKKYKFAYTMNNTSWTVINAYSTKSKIEWTPSKAGTYTVRAFVTDGNNTVKKDVSITVKSTYKPISIDTLKTFSSDIKVGDTVKLGASATGGSGTLKYKFEYTRTGNGWVKIQDYAESRYPTFTPKYAGTYTIKVSVTDGNTTTTKSITLEVAENKIVIDTLKSFSSDIKVGDTVKLGASATGGSGTLKYKFEYTRTGNSWVKIQDYAESRYPTFTPKYAGTYTIKVSVTDGNTTTSKTITLTVK